MSYDVLSALILFALATSLTPGPNNLMLMASGANFGFRRSVPHMLGIGIGFTVMVVLVGVGLIAVFDTYPIAYLVLKVISVVYLSYLAWKIARASAPTDAGPAGRPFSFLQAALFQWVNPKSWTMALSAVTLYAPDQTIGGVLMVAVIFGSINMPSVGCWTLLGQQVRRILTNPLRLQAFNITMALLLIASMLPLIL